MRAGKILLLLLLFLASAAPATSPTTRPGPTNLIVWSSYIRQDVPELWLAEARRKVDNPLLFMCHGMSVPVDGKLVWYVNPDKPRKPQPVQEVARTLSNLYPDRNIILVVCNPAHERISIARVWYPERDVWIVPDEYCDFLDLIERSEPQTIGTFADFTSPPSSLP
jgi:hypothetical protein